MSRSSYPYHNNLNNMTSGYPSHYYQGRSPLQVPSSKHQWQQRYHHHHLEYTPTAGTRATSTWDNTGTRAITTIRALQPPSVNAAAPTSNSGIISTAAAAASNLQNNISNNIIRSNRTNQNCSTALCIQRLPQLIDCSHEVQKQMVYVMINLQRESSTKPWGIAFSKFSDAIVIGGASTTKVQDAMTWCHVVWGYEYTLDAKKIYRHSNDNDDANNNTGKEDYANAIEDYAKSMTPNHLRHHHQNDSNHQQHDERLYPGDLIVALDGREPGCFPTLSDTTHYFRSKNRITLVVLRHPKITASALSLSLSRNNPKYGMKTPTASSSSQSPNSILSGEASDFAFKMWLQILGPKALGRTSSYNRGYGEVRKISSNPHHPHQVTLSNVFERDNEIKRRIQIQQIQQERQKQKQQEQEQQLPTASQTTNNNDSAALDLLVQIALMQQTTAAVGKPPASYDRSMMTMMMMIPPPADAAVNIVSPTTTTPFVHRLTQNEIVTLIKHPQEQQPVSSSYKKNPPASSSLLSSPSPSQTVTTKASTSLPSPNFYVPETWHNPLFRNEDGQPLQYEDNWEFSPEDGCRAKLFIRPIHDDFQTWMKERKKTWRSRYKVYKITSSATGDGLDTARNNSNKDDEWEYEDRTVAVEFWKHRNIDSFDDWLSQSLSKWNHSFSWNKRKRKRIQKECEEVVHISQVSTKPEFMHWLHIRKNQWRLGLLRRKRQRQRLEAEMKDNVDPSPMLLEDHPDQKNYGHSTTVSQIPKLDSSQLSLSSPRKRPKLMSPTSNEMTFFDDILEEEERHRKVIEERHPIDISFLFDSSLGAPDDVVVHCLKFLERSEHGKLLCISRTTSSLLARRENVWRQLCPSHWILPRRPRKPWHRLYITKLRDEHLAKQKRWDDLMLKLSSTLLKGDHLQKIQKLLAKGEKEFGFTVNYVSPVVCERNSVLNLSVINQRHKIVRWLVDEKGADIETYDRGRFTPLLNAAWAGDRQLVRFFLQRGSDRTVVGTGHYSEGLAPADFKGLTAEHWARKRGHTEIAELIRLGL